MASWPPPWASLSGCTKAQRVRALTLGPATNLRRPGSLDRGTCTFREGALPTSDISSVAKSRPSDFINSSGMVEIIFLAIVPIMFVAFSFRYQVAADWRELHNSQTAWPWVGAFIGAIADSTIFLAFWLAVSWFYFTGKVATGVPMRSSLLIALWSRRSSEREVAASSGLTAESAEVLHDPLGVMRLGVERSVQVVRSIRGWATANLMTGVFIGFVGVGIFFYSATIGAMPVDERTTVGMLAVESLASTIPKVAVLVFVEIIAVFFLKQYRISMDEYRALEAVLRLREAQLFAAVICANEPPNDKLLNLSEKILETAKLQVLKRGETTEILESMRLNSNNEVANVFQQMADVAGKAASAFSWRDNSGLRAGSEHERPPAATDPQTRARGSRAATDFSKP